MPQVITAVSPVTLFGSVVPGLFGVKSGSRILALVKPKAKKTVEVKDGDLKSLGLTAQAVRKQIEALR